jgi:hypothetical protein
MRKRRPSWIGATLVVTLTLALPCRADAPTREYQVKAAFLYNFTQFVEWPDSAFASKDSPFIVATVGDDPFSGFLEKLTADKIAADRPIRIVHFDSPDHIAYCQVLFVPASQAGSIAVILDKVGQRPVLTVGETESFTSSGGTMRFFLEDNRMRFEINTDAAESSGIKVSAKLMKLARIFKK